jgi:hypothetical protein
MSTAAQKTGATVFPHALRYQNMLIASDDPITIDPARFDEVAVGDQVPPTEEGNAVVPRFRFWLDGRDRVVRVEGITGRRISGFTVTRDGTALVAVLGTGTNPSVEVSNLVRDADGRLQRATTARTLQISGADLGAARDVAQSAATTLSILTRPAAGPDQVVELELDGSPSPAPTAAVSTPDPVPGPVSGLVANPDPALGLRIVTTDGRMYSFVDDAHWVRDPLTSVVAAAYAQ